MRASDGDGRESRGNSVKPGKTRHPGRPGHSVEVREGRAPYRLSASPVENAVVVVAPHLWQETNDYRHLHPPRGPVPSATTHSGANI
jgi:hypothetical protein